MSGDLLARAQDGDEDAFRQLVEPYQKELQLHCYRIVGSLQDAEDVLQETLLAAWRGLPGFQRRSSVRTWLYRVATSRCLNALRSRERRPGGEMVVPRPELPEPSRLGEVLWLEPYPDALIENLSDSVPGPEAQYEAREAVSLAFVTALQLLPPRQRAVLILRDAVGFHAAEVAQILQATEDSVNSALKRARATMTGQLHSASEQEPPPCRTLRKSGSWSNGSREPGKARTWRASSRF
jgi:RNA polymerase sigma-70 factor (TIGR02960 family)